MPADWRCWWDSYLQDFPSSVGVARVAQASSGMARPLGFVLDGPRPIRQDGELVDLDQSHRGSMAPTG